MRSARKTLSRLLIAYILVLIFLSLLPHYEYNHNYDRAFIAWYKNPTPESEAAFRVQQGKRKIRLLEFDAAGAFLVVAVGYGVLSLVRLTIGLTKSYRHPST